MFTRCMVGTGVTGVGKYVLGEGKGAGADTLAPGAESRVGWIGGQHFGFVISGQADARLALKIMEFDALNQASRTRPCLNDAVHLMLAWRIGETPSREGMETAARDALGAIGMGTAKAIWTMHRDEAHPHLHIVASKIDPAIGRAYDLKGNYIKLSEWALAYEREHGGVMCLRREGADALRQSISRGNPGAILEAITRQRSTFTVRELEAALGKQIPDDAVRAALRAAVLGLPDVVRLTDPQAEAAARYTSRQVIEVEQRALTAAADLRERGRHGLGRAGRELIAGGGIFAALNAEQRQAIAAATDDRGLALIDGQAGAGKSFTLAAIRQAYEAEGCHVVGLAPTNVVARDLARDGFFRGATVQSELFALHNRRRQWDVRTVVIVDEAAMVGSGLMAQLMEAARDRGAKLVLAGDDRQLASIDRGGLFGALKDRYGAATLSEVTRQHKDEERRAASMMAEGNFHGALTIFDGRGAITWAATQREARDQLIESWARGSAAQPDKSRFVFAYTNVDVLELNAGLRAVRRARGELGKDHPLTTADGVMPFAMGDRVQLLRSDKRQNLINATVGTVTAIDDKNLEMRMDGQGGLVRIDTERFTSFRYGYAGTIYKGQGRTLDETYLYHSPHWRAASSYVGLTRHRDQTTLFVARETAPDLAALARQMARVDERRAAVQFLIAAPANDSGRGPATGREAGQGARLSMEDAEIAALMSSAEEARSYETDREAENEHDLDYG